MNIDMIIELIKSVPKDKLNNDETIKTILDQAAKKAGKTYTEDQLNTLLKQFKEFSQDRSPTSLIPKILYRGGSEEQMDEIREKLDS